MNARKLFYFVITLFINQFVILPAKSQTTDSGFFSSPLSIPLKLTSTFNELRLNQFHPGIDFSTNDTIGIPVLASGDGYISRIKISPTGYGKAIYIIHPNGLMTVYGHLSKLNDTLQNFMTKMQYIHQSFDVDQFFTAKQFPVKKGDLIGYSGSTGLASGPHLHFEIRDASGESYPLNPLAYHLAVTDSVAPKLYQLVLYDEQKKDSLFFDKAQIFYSVSKNNSTYQIAGDTLFSPFSETAFGIKAWDFWNVSDTENPMGVYSLEENFDDEKVFSFQMNRLDFGEARYVNACMDYAQAESKSEYYYRLFRLPGNFSPLYSNEIHNGIIDISDRKTHVVEIIARDFFGNTSKLIFKIKWKNNLLKSNFSLPASSRILLVNKPNTFFQNDFGFSLPKNAVYADYAMPFSITGSLTKNIYSKIYSLGNEDEPIHSAGTIKILPDKSIPENLKKKSIIVYRNGRGNTSGKTSKWDGNFLSASFTSFGDYFIEIDQTPPTIQMKNLKANDTLKTNFISAIINDDLSGVESYTATIDGKWILMEYDLKNNLITYTVDKNLIAGKHVFELTVNDEVGNSNTITIPFYL
jgi:hypothetical protein